MYGRVNTMAERLSFHPQFLARSFQIEGRRLHSFCTIFMLCQAKRKHAVAIQIIQSTSNQAKLLHALYMRCSHTATIENNSISARSLSISLFSRVSWNNFVTKLVYVQRLHHARCVISSTQRFAKLTILKITVNTFPKSIETGKEYYHGR